MSCVLLKTIISIEYLCLIYCNSSYLTLLYKISANNQSLVADFRKKMLMCWYEYIPISSFFTCEDRECLVKNQPYLGTAAFLSERKLIERFGSYRNKIYSRSCVYFFHINSFKKYVCLIFFIIVKEKKKSLSLRKSTVTYIGIFSALIKPRDLFQRTSHYVCFLEKMQQWALVKQRIMPLCFKWI